MMKKYIKLLLIFTLFLLPNVVFADSRFGGTNRHILTVEELNVVNSKITFKGYSFISHMDNLGIMADDGFEVINGNLQTYLIVYVGDWKDIYGENTEIDIDTCEENSNCYIKAATMVPRSFFYSRCTDAGCANYDKIKKHRVRTKKLLNDTTCHSGEDDYDLDGDGKKNDDNECLYENVGFTVTVDVSTIVDELTSGEFYDNYTGVGCEENEIECNEEERRGIKFKIMAYNTALGEGLASGFNIHSNSCFVNGDSCKGTTIKTSSYEFKLSDFASTVNYDASKGIPHYLNKNGELVPKDKGFFESDDGYNIEKNVDNVPSLIIRTKEKTSSSCGGKNNWCGLYRDMFVLLDTEELSNKNLAPDDTPDNDDYYYAPANHLTFGGEFKIDVFKILMKKIECNQIVGIGEDDSEDKEMECGQSKTFNQCKKSGDNGASVSGTIYYYDANPVCASNNKYLEIKEGGKTNYYLPVEVNADVLIIQEGKFSFEKFTPEIVRAGKGFSFKNDVGGVTYENNVSFLIAGKYNNPDDQLFYNTPYINFNATRYKVNETTNKCELDLDFSIDEKVRKYYSEYDSNGESMKKSSLFYFYNDKGIFERGNSLEAASFAIGNSFFSNKAKNYDNIKENDKVLSDIFKFESCDSNSSSPKCDITSIVGSWTEETKDAEWVRLEENNNSYQRYIRAGGSSPYNGIEYRVSSSHRGFGKIVSRVYKYSLPHAYVVLYDSKVNGTKYKSGDIIYSKEKISDSDLESNNLKYVGNKYFVGFKYVYNNTNINEFDFPFNLIKSNISFVEGMTWNLTGTCGVDVKNGFYKPKKTDCAKDDCDVEAKILYKFRPISLSQPFPKGIATNWQDWYSISTNEDRLKDTKNYGVKYRIWLSKFDVNDDYVVKLSDINSLQIGSYNELFEYSSNGTSKFVNDMEDKNIKFAVKQGTTSYCGLGYFSSNCDQYANSMG